MDHTAAAQIDVLIEGVRKLAPDLCILLVANVIGDFDPRNGSPLAQAASEYFSDAELSQMVDGFAESGFSYRFFNGELSFIKEMIAGSIAEIGTPHKLVYSTAQSGEGAGRKSLVPAFCRLMGQPFCNSDAYVLSLVRNKFHVHSILAKMGLSVPPSWVYAGGGRWLGDAAPPPGMMLIAKLLYESASIGLDERSIGIISSGYVDVLEERFSKFRQPIIVQKFLSGFEVEVPILDINGGLVLPPVSVLREGTHMGERILNFSLVAEDLYDLVALPEIDERFGAQLRSAALKAFSILGIQGLGRVDFRIDSAGQAFITDVSTTPHMVRHGALSSAFSALGFSHPEMLAAMVAINAQRFGWF